MNKSIALTAAAVALVVLAATGALFALGARYSDHPPCGRLTPSEARAVTDPGYAQRLEQLARCEPH